MSAWQLADIHHLGLTVADIDRSIEFYRDTLGMTLIGRRPCVEEGYVSKQTGYEGVKLGVASFRIRPDCAGPATFALHGCQWKWPLISDDTMFSRRGLQVARTRAEKSRML